MVLETMSRVLVQIVCPVCPSQEGEKKGITPEEVYTSVQVSRDSSVLPCKWLKAELPGLLDQVRMLVSGSSLQSCSGKTTADDQVSSLVLEGCGFKVHCGFFLA